MIENGIAKVAWDSRDYDHLRSFGLTTFDATSLPTDFNSDAGLTMPSQLEPNPTFNIPALFYGCTGYTQTELCQDEDLRLYNPYYTYTHTYPYNLTAGRDVRLSLRSVCKDGVEDVNGVIGNTRSAYYNVEQAGKIDYFDAIRIVIWVNQGEHRTVSMATPWYPEWSSPTNGILAVPSDFRWTAQVSGHNYKAAGWKTINGVPYLMIKPWIGKQYGDGGWAYMSREICNAILNINGTGCFVVGKKVDAPATVQRNVIEALVDFVRGLFHL